MIIYSGVRETFNIRLKEAARGVQELLGHASITSTQIYTHVSAVRLLESYLKAHPGTVKSAGTP